jgi:hypothetical protein
LAELLNDAKAKIPSMRLDAFEEVRRLFLAAVEELEEGTTGAKKEREKGGPAL